MEKGKSEPHYDAVGINVDVEGMEEFATNEALKLIESITDFCTD